MAANESTVAPFAKLVPANPLAIVLVRQAIEFLDADNSDHLKYYIAPAAAVEGGESVEGGGTNSEDGNAIEGGINPELEAAINLTAGFFQMSFDNDRPQPRGWTAGRIRSIEESGRDVHIDFALEPPNIRSKSKAIAPLQLLFQFHHHSGALFVQNLDSEKVVRICEDTKTVRLKKYDRRVLSQRKTSIHLGKAHFTFEITVTDPQYLTDYFERLGKHLYRGREVDSTRFVRCLPGINSTKIGSIDAMVLEHTVAGGTFGTVQQAINLSTGEPLAIKRIRNAPRIMGGSPRGEVLREWRIATVLSGKRGIIKTLDLVCEHGHRGERVADCDAQHEYIYLTAQLARSDFSTFNKEKIAAPQRLAIYRDTLLGISNMHKMGYMHRDIQLGNLLILSTEKESPRGCVIDFGKAFQIPENGIKVHYSRIGPLYSLAPEVLSGEGYTETIDLFSWAVTIAMTLGLRPPWANAGSEARVVQQESLKTFHQILMAHAHANEGLNSLVDLLVSILRWEEGERPTVSQALEHECWKGLDRLERCDTEDDGERKRRKLGKLSSQSDSLPPTLPFSHPSV